jgi:hypothetical protein
MRLKDVKPGTNIRITQVSYSPSRPDREFTIEGKFLGCKVSDTGAPFAHAKTRHYQMLRVRLEKDDGEISEMNIDPRTRISIIA